MCVAWQYIHLEPKLRHMGPNPSPRQQTGSQDGVSQEEGFQTRRTVGHSMLVGRRTAAQQAEIQSFGVHLSPERPLSLRARSGCRSVLQRFRNFKLKRWPTKTGDNGVGWGGGGHARS